MIAAIQTHGELLHWHPHCHVLITCGAFTPTGDFIELPQFDLERLLVAWREQVFTLYLAEEKIEPEVVENMLTWRHSGFSADQSVFLPADDQAGIERLIQYMTRCPFSLARMVKVSDSGQVVYQAEKQVCQAYPDPNGDGTTSGVKRNFQILPVLDFLADFTQHIPDKGSHLTRYYGWYSNKSRGVRKKAEVAASAAAGDSSSENDVPPRSNSTWAMLIKRIYEVDPLICPQCGGQMKVVAFIEPPQSEVIEKILRHCGLWHPWAPRSPPDPQDFVLELDAGDTAIAAEHLDEADQTEELTYVDIDTFLATF